MLAADVLLWRNKKIASSVLAAATAIWVFFEWLDYHFLTIVSFALFLGMVVQFVWFNFSNMLSGQSLDCGAAAVIGSWCNFLTVVYIGFVCAHTLPVLYEKYELPVTGFVCAHTLPVLYEKYEDQVDDFLYSILGLLRDQYQKLDQGVLSKIPKGNLKAKKNE